MFIKQYELWQTCNNNCIFCFNKEGRGLYNPIQQKHSLEFVLKDLDRVVEKHKNLAVELIGGDIFQGQLRDKEVKALFFTLLRKIKSYGDRGLIKQLVLFCTLTIGEQEDLYSSLDIVLGGPMEIWVSTSYDTKGRFNSQSQWDTWNKQMLRLSQIPNLYRNTTIIFTQDFCEKVLSGELNLKKFQDKYKTTLFFKHPLPPAVTNYHPKKEEDSKQVFYTQKKAEIERIPWFFPKRQDALKVMAMMNSLGILDRLMGLDYRADDLDNKWDDSRGFLKTIRDKENNIEDKSEDTNSCGHLLSYVCYQDSDRCLLCDKENIYGED